MRRYPLYFEDGGDVDIGDTGGDTGVTPEEEAMWLTGAGDNWAATGDAGSDTGNWTMDSNGTLVNTVTGRYIDADGSSGFYNLGGEGTDTPTDGYDSSGWLASLIKQAGGATSGVNWGKLLNTGLGAYAMYNKSKADKANVNAANAGNAAYLDALKNYKPGSSSSSQSSYTVHGHALTPEYTQAFTAAHPAAVQIAAPTIQNTVAQTPAVGQKLRGGGQPIGALAAATNAPRRGYIAGNTGGQADQVDAKVSHGEYVFDADTVAALGDGNNAAGAAKLDKWREELRAHKRAASKATIPPKAKAPQAYLKGK